MENNAFSLENGAIPQTDLEYVAYYAELLKTHPDLFDQQKRLIESQMKSSRETFSKMFGKENFKENARKYLIETDRM
jgi:hypothetical protein